jgi:hypothetical protein
MHNENEGRKSYSPKFGWKLVVRPPASRPGLIVLVCWAPRWILVWCRHFIPLRRSLIEKYPLVSLSK